MGGTFKMLFFYGYRHKGVLQKKLEDQKCEHCGSTDIYGVGSIKYTHVFWIPFFAYGRKVNTVCMHCKANKSKKEIDKPYYKQLKGEVFDNLSLLSKFRFNIGLISLIIFIAYAAMS